MNAWYMWMTVWDRNANKHSSRLCSNISLLLEIYVFSNHFHIRSCKEPMILCGHIWEVIISFVSLSGFFYKNWINLVKFYFGSFKKILLWLFESNACIACYVSSWNRPGGLLCSRGTCHFVDDDVDNDTIPLINNCSL